MLFQEKESHLMQIKLLQNAMTRENKSYNEAGTSLNTKRGNEDLKADFASRNDQIKKLRNELEENSTALTQYKDQLAAKTSMIYHLQQTNNDLRAKLEEYKSKVDLTEEKIRLYKQKHEEMRNTMIVIRNNMEKSKLTLEEKDRQLKQLKFALDSPDRLTRRFEDPSLFVSPDFNKMTPEKEELEKNREHIKDLNERLQNIQADNQRLYLRTNKIPDMEDELLNLQSQYAMLEKEFQSREETYVAQIFNLEEQIKGNNSDMRISDSEIEQPPPNQNLHTSMTQLSSLSIQDALFTCKNLMGLVESLINSNVKTKRIKDMQTRLDNTKKEIENAIKFDIEPEISSKKEPDNREGLSASTVTNILEIVKDLEKKLKEELELRTSLQEPKSQIKLNLSNLERISDSSHEYCKIELKNMHHTIQELKHESSLLMIRLEKGLKENRFKEEHIQKILLNSTSLDFDLQTSTSLVVEYENLICDLKKYLKSGLRSEKAIEDKAKAEIENEELRERVKNLKQKLYEERSKSDREVMKFRHESDIVTEKNETTSNKLEILNMKFTKLKLDNDCLKIKNNELLEELDALKKPLKETESKFKRINQYLDRLKSLSEPGGMIVEDIF